MDISKYRTPRQVSKSDSNIRSLFLSPPNKPTTQNPDLAEDIDSVTKLDLWNYSKAHECLTRTNTARESLERKLKSEDLVEKMLQRRKFGSQPLESGPTYREKTKYYKNYEEECLNAYKEIQNKLVIKIESRDNIRKTQIDLKNELDSDQKKLKEIEKQRILSPYKLAITKNQDESPGILASLIKKRNSFIQKANETREVLIQNVEMLQIEIKNRAKDLQVVENEIDTLRKGLKLVKQDIIRYFMETLKQGNDTRGEGIYTTVKHLIGFKIDLKNENFPGVLDEASISCIQNIALKHIVLDELYEKLAQCYSNKGSISHHSLSIQDRIASLKKTIVVRKPDYSGKKKKKHGWFKEEFLNVTQETFYSGCSETIRLEERINSVKAEIQELKENEVRRLTRECLKTGKDVNGLVSLIVGSDYLVKYKVVMLKEFQNVEKVKEKTRTFSFTEYLVPRPKLNFAKK